MLTPFIQVNFVKKIFWIFKNGQPVRGNDVKLLNKLLQFWSEIGKRVIFEVRKGLFSVQFFPIFIKIVGVYLVT